jgi:hypothetical protein
VRRRAFITLLGGSAVTWPLAARAQQPERVRRIGVLMGYAESDSDAQAWYAAFQEGRQVAGTAQGDCTAHYPGCYAIQPDIGDLCRILVETLKSSRSIVGRGGDSSACW